MRRLPLVVVTLGLLLAVGACGSDTDDVSSTPTEQTSATPGDAYQAAAWNPPVPDQPVDPTAVESEYAPVVDALVDATGKAKTFGKAEVVTELHVSRGAEVCSVGVRRTGDEIVPDDFYLFQQDLAAAVKDLGFGDLASDKDPGGAVVFVAHDVKDSLLEFRSKGQSTVTVYVPTAASEC